MKIQLVGRYLLVALVLLAGLLDCGARAKKEEPAPESFLSGDFFTNGMALADAEKLVADPEQWQIVFRIDTPSTCDLAVVWRRQFFWRLSFYKGGLYAIEKRGEVEPEVVEATFKALGEQHGESREATRSEDGGLVYSRWRLEPLEISMTASREPDGLYRMTYEEADTDLLSTARRRQEQEMQAAPGDIDPITGLPRIHQHKNDPGAEPPADDSKKGKAKQKNKKSKGKKAKDKQPEDQTPGDDPPTEDPPKDGAGQDQGQGSGDSDGDEAKTEPVKSPDPGDW